MTVSKYLMVEIKESSDAQAEDNLMQFYTRAHRGVEVDDIVEENGSHGYQLDPSLFSLPVAPCRSVLNNE